MERLVEVEQISFEEENNEVSLRPSSWNDYIGQEKIKKNLVHIRTLEKLRDTLLPKLMSGEVRVRLRQQN